MESYGYRFDTPDRSIVISGDTNPTQAKPGLLILYHASLSLRPAVDAERSTPATLLNEMARYPGRVVVGRDLDVY